MTLLVGAAIIGAIAIASVIGLCIHYLYWLSTVDGNDEEHYPSER